MDSFYESSGRSRIPKWLLVLGLCFGAIAYFWSQSDHVTATALAAVTLAGFGGYRVGAAKLIGFFAGMAFAVALAPTYGRQLEPSFSEWFGTSGFGNRALSMGATGFAIVVVVVLTTQLFTLWMIKDRPLLQGCNKWLGFSVGVVQGSAVTLLLIGGLLVVEPLAKNRLYSGASNTNSKMGESVARRVIQYAGRVRESAIGPWIAEYNPFRRVPQLTQLLHSMQAVSNPHSLQLSNHDGQGQFGHDPSMLQKLGGLREDPQVIEFLESGQAIDAESALSLLNNPSVKKVLDQPEILGQLNELLDKSGQ